METENCNTKNLHTIPISVRLQSSRATKSLHKLKINIGQPLQFLLSKQLSMPKLIKQTTHTHEPSLHLAIRVNRTSGTWPFTREFQHKATLNVVYILLQCAITDR